MHYVCSDIHGRWDKYQEMLTTLKLEEEDRLYILGDVIDRGPDGIRILQDIIRRENVSFLIGNHELFLYCCCKEADEDLVETWIQNGGAVTMEAFLGLAEEEQDEILGFLEKSYVAIPDLMVEEKHYYLVHAFPDLHYRKQPVRLSDMTHGEAECKQLWSMVWERVDTRIWQGDMVMYTLYCENRKVIIGHTITTYFSRFNQDKHGRATIHHDKYFVALDCGCAASGDKACLGVLRLDDGKEFYF